MLTDGIPVSDQVWVALPLQILEYFYPMVEKGKKVLSSPICVWPSTTT